MQGSSSSSVPMHRTNLGGGGSAAAAKADLSRESAEQLPLVVTLHCLDDPFVEQDGLSGIASIEHVGLAHITSGRIESASAVLIQSLAFLPRAAQRRLQPWQLVLCLGSADRAVDSALAADLGLRLVHVDAGRAEEVADTVMALFLGLLRRTHTLASHVSSAASAASGWLGLVQPLCRGMRRCRGLVLGIVGRSASARCLATRSLAFRMSVLYFDLHQKGKGNSSRSSIAFPAAARRMDTLNDLLAASDLISLHCALTDETVHIINAECLQHIKPGVFIVNTSSSQLIDDCALKQLLINGTVAGCALDGAEGPQWMEAWVREIPNVLILPRSADYSEEVWMEIREKAVSVLHGFFLDGVVPDNAVSDEDGERSETGYDVEDDMSDKHPKENPPHDVERMTDESQLDPEYGHKKGIYELEESYLHHPNSGLTQSVVSQPEGRRSRSSKKSKKRPAQRHSHQKSGEYSGVERDSNSTSKYDDDAAMSGTDPVLSSDTCSPSTEHFRNKQICMAESAAEPASENDCSLIKDLSTTSNEVLKDGYVIALHARDRPGFHVSRQRLPGGGWYLDTVANVTKKDPATQFLVTFRSKDILGLRSLAAGGKLLQINRRMEFVFASYSFDVWESWMVEGSSIEECKLVNSRNSLATLDVRIEILAVVGEDGVTRWLD